MSKKSFSGGVDSFFQETASDYSKQEDNEAIKQENNKAGKEKATFNLSKQLLQDLEDTWIEIRKARGNKKLSKTAIVEFAVHQMLTDFKARGQESKLYSFIERNNL